MTERFKRVLGVWGLTTSLCLALAQPTPASPVGATQPAPESFYDLPETHWAYRAVRELTDLGILTGYPDGRFDGTRATTRYELAVVAARLLTYVDEVAAVSGGAAEGIAEDAALSSAPLEARTAQLEAALAGAASLEYTRRLEARIVALEAALNDAQGGALFPAQLEGEADAQGVVTPTPTAQAMAGDTVATPLPELQVQFSAPPAHPFYVGVSPGVVSTAGDVYLSVQAGYDSLVGPVGPAARLTFNGGNRELRVAVDALARADILNEDLKLYGGLGFGGTVRPSGGAWLLEAPFGTEYLLTPRLGLFLQLVTSYGFTPVNNVDAELSTGFNLRF